MHAGGKAVFKACPKGFLIVKLYVDGRKLFKESTHHNDLTAMGVKSAHVSLLGHSGVTLAQT